MNTIAYPSIFAPTLLPDFALLQIQGADAASFIHNQLSQDFLLLGSEAARLAVWCTPQGRTLISFYGFKPQADMVFLLLAADSVEFILKRLKMYVLRSKCTVSDVSADWCISGHIAPTGSSVGASAMASRSLASGAYALQLPNVALDKQVFAREIRLQPLQAECNVAVNASSLLWWDWLQVQSGVALVGAAVREAFVPQMINYESVGGINFKKGCYPGQEVVARSQFRGQVKRRAYLVTAATELEAGAEVLDAQGQACGLVAMCAASPLRQGWAAIVSVQTNSAEAGGLQVGEHSLTLHDLPYALLDDI
jgi:hypothetical protein